MSCFIFLMFFGVAGSMTGDKIDATCLLTTRHLPEHIQHVGSGLYLYTGCPECGTPLRILVSKHQSHHIGGCICGRRYTEEASKRRDIGIAQVALLNLAPYME